MELIRVRRNDGKSVICDHIVHEGIMQEGVIVTEETWTRFCNDLPSPQSRRFKGVILVTSAEDQDFDHPIDACTMREYPWMQALRWLQINSKPRPVLEPGQLWTRERRNREVGFTR